MTVSVSGSDEVEFRRSETALPYTHLAQTELLDFTETAAEQGFLNLANATTEFVEALTTEDQPFGQTPI